MNKELDYIQRHINIVKQQVKGSKMKIIVTDAVTKHQYDYYENELQTLESIEKSLLELKSIKEANPSEALECLEDIYRNAVFISDYNVFGKQHPTNISPETNKSISIQCDTIKQALIQAEQDRKELEEYKKIFKALFKEIVFEEKGHTTHKNWVRNNEYADWYEIKLTNEYGFQINNIYLTKDERDVFIKKMKEALE